MLNPHWQYLKYVLRHKWFVFRSGLKLGVPLYLLILHDISKFRPSEWFPYVHYFYGRPKLKDGYIHTPGSDGSFDLAWLKHQKRNKHHWQWWVLIYDNNVEPKTIEMPDRYMREMLADWMGAGMAQGKPDTLAWWMKNKPHIMLHAGTAQWIERKLLGQDEKLHQ